MSRGLARLWVLGAVRRPLRALVIVFTLVVVSVATVGSLVAADSLSHLFTADAQAEWGTVDVEGHALRTSVFDDSLGRFLVSKAGGRITAGAPRLVLAAAARSGSRMVHGTVLGLGAEEQRFPALTHDSGSANLQALQADEALVNRRLADRLHVAVGDQVDLVVAVPEWQESRSNLAMPLRHPAIATYLSLKIAGVVANSGTADLHRTPMVLMSRSVLQRAVGFSVGLSTVLDLHTAQPGKAAGKALIDALDPIARRAGVGFAPVRQDALDTAAGEGGLFRSLLLVLAVLVVLAAVGGVVDLVVSLVRERTPELAQLRAQGAPVVALRRAVVSECALYGVVGTGLGILAAMPFANALARALSDHLASLNAGRGREQVLLVPDVRPVTVALGAAVVLLTACLAGRSAASRALAAEPEELLRGEVAGATLLSPRRPVLLLAAGSAALGVGGGALMYLGLTLLLLSGWLWRRRLATDRDSLDRRAALIGLVWSVAGAALLGDFSHGVQAGFGVMSVAGELAVVCACVLVTPSLRAVMRGVRLYAAQGTVQWALISAGAQAQRHPARSGRSMSVIAGAVFGVVALSVLGSAADLPSDRQSGGFAAIGTSVAGLDQAALSGPDVTAAVAVPHADLPELAYRVEDPDGKRMTVPYPVRLIAAEADLVSQQQWGLAASLPQYRTAADALTAVIVDGDKAVVDRFSRPEGAQPGDDVVLDLGAGPRRFRLIAVLDTFLPNGVFVGDAPFREQGLAHGNTFVLARAADPKRAMRALEAAGRDKGLTMKSVMRAAQDVVAVNRSFTDVFALMLALALIVMVASQAAGITRAARERRGELAVQLALGMRRRSLTLELAAEPLLLAFVGQLIGALVGAVVLRALFASGFSDLPFRLEVARLGVLLAITSALAMGTSVLAAAWAVRSLRADDLSDVG